MKLGLYFLEEEIAVSSLGKESSVPDILSQLNIQNKTVFDLEEEDEIYEGFGKIDTVYPYRQYTCYDRATKIQKVKTAVLENQFIKAVFLPEFGGRLWRLIDKETGENLLYTNDVIQPANLATRNAWFSGGVEWNIGIIGHTPLTMDALFTAMLEDEKGNPVLRMYEYERIRKVVYQMDFWLEPEGKFLNCRMRIVNDSKDVVPMYWWSNMAVPEYEKGRIILPAKEAYTSDFSRVYKVDIPMVDGVDVSKYNGIPNQVDYFFHILKESPKYITHLNKEGYGLLHISTNRLQSRKLFVWGQNEGGTRWQEFLTKNAGNYIEIQAGLGKTQYGCIPMAPHTAWEWVEQYGAISLEKEVVECKFEKAEKKVSKIVKQIFKVENPEKKLTSKKEIALKEGELVIKGSGYGDLENACRIKLGEKILAKHLDFKSFDKRQDEWKEYLEKGCFAAHDIKEKPIDFSKDDIWFEKLKESINTKDAKNWYAHYQLGLHYFYRKSLKKAQKEFVQSLDCIENPWANHALAVCGIKENKEKEALYFVKKALDIRINDLSFVKEAFYILLYLKAYQEIITYYERLEKELKKEGRIVFGYIQALAGVKEYKKAMELLEEGGGLEIADIREGDTTLNSLWKEVSKAIYGDENKKILPKLNFKALL